MPMPLFFFVFIHHELERSIDFCSAFIIITARLQIHFAFILRSFFGACDLALEIYYFSR